MEVMHPRCCGIDVHQASLAVCVAIKETSQAEKYKLVWGGHHGGIAAPCGLAARLPSDARGHGSYRRVLEAGVACLGRSVRVAVGESGARAGAAWQKDRLERRRADRGFLQHSLLQGSFVPSQPIQQLRDLTRRRTTLKREQCRIGNRIRKVLEDANVKLSSVLSDMMGLSGRDMLRAIVKGDSDPAELAKLVRGRLCGKIPVIQQAATEA